MTNVMNVYGYNDTRFINIHIISSPQTVGIRMNDNASFNTIERIVFALTNLKKVILPKEFRLNMKVRTPDSSNP